MSILEENMFGFIYIAGTPGSSCGKNIQKSFYCQEIAKHIMQDVCEGATCIQWGEFIWHVSEMSTSHLSQVSCQVSRHNVFLIDLCDM